ncbi:hypothetical protein DPMN_123146 [Dreissena polymorpha]|uniref:Uncharacterized protein n=1 Tax=Dreissena polymorpha TaxID=45954 RepID=A0A9D4GR20_DREPO|nr:hypothetical protein DPMN_123146 [Dreissena polymorpha]
MEAAMIKLETIRVYFARVLNADKASSDEQSWCEGPDLAPLDFRVFPEVKSQLRGIRFASKQELTVAAKRIVLSFDADWIMKLHRYIDHDLQITPIDV